MSHFSEILRSDINDIIEQDNVPAVVMQAPDADTPNWADDIVIVIPGRVKGEYKPISEWPLIWRQQLKGMEIESRMVRSTDGVMPNWDVAARVAKITYLDRNRVSELAGNHKAVDAFVQQQRGPELHLHLHSEVESRLLRAREVAATRDRVELK